jgi:hypothetical protein
MSARKMSQALILARIVSLTGDVPATLAVSESTVSSTPSAFSSSTASLSAVSMKRRQSLLSRSLCQE